MNKNDSPQKPIAGISIENASDITFNDAIVEGGDVGILARNVSGLTINQMRYEGPGVAVDITGKSAEIKNSRAITSETRKEPGGRYYGYTKPNGPPLPAQCPNCKSIFPSRHYNVAVPLFLSKNNKESCPVCGSPDANLAEGVFNLVGEVVAVIDAEGLSLEILRSMGAVAAGAISGATRIDAALEMIGEISPSVAVVLRQGLARKMIAGVLFVLGAMAAYNMAHDFNNNTGATDHVRFLYSEASKFIVEKVGDHEYKINKGESSEQAGITKQRSQEFRKRRDKLKNSTAIPLNVPVPIPRPTGPKSDRKN